MNATFYFENTTQAERFGNALRECFIHSVTSGKMVEIYNFSMIKEEYKKHVLVTAKAIYKEVITDAGAVEKFQKMSMQECIDFWNEYATDQFNQLVSIHPMEDESWWNHLARELGAWDLMHFVWDSRENFNDSDLYFLYIENNCRFFSFSTKQEFVEYMGNDFFLDTLANLE